MIGMFQHEHKMSVLNVVLKRTSNYSLPIKSKERLVFQCGYRRFIVNPVFSSHTNGQKHKVSKEYSVIIEIITVANKMEANVSFFIEVVLKALLIL